MDAPETERGTSLHDLGGLRLCLRPLFKYLLASILFDKILFTTYNYSFAHENETLKDRLAVLD